MVGIVEIALDVDESYPVVLYTTVNGE